MKNLYCFLALVCLLPCFHTKAINSLDEDGESDIDKNQFLLMKGLGGDELKEDNERFLGMLAKLIPTAIKGITALINKAQKKQRFEDEFLMELGMSETDLAELGEDKERFLGMLAKLIPAAVKGIGALINKAQKKQRFEDELLMELGMSENDLAELGEDKERFLGMLAKLIPAAVKGIGALINKAKKKQRFDDESLMELELTETDSTELEEDNERFFGILASLIPMAVKGITALVNKAQKKQRFNDDFGLDY